MIRKISILILPIACTLFAQFETSTVLGTVRDKTGAVVAGAAVTLENVATGIKATATTGVVGFHHRSCMSGDAHVQFWEGLGVRFPGATQQK